MNKASQIFLSRIIDRLNNTSVYFGLKHIDQDTIIMYTGQLYSRSIKYLERKTGYKVLACINGYTKFQRKRSSAGRGIVRNDMVAAGTAASPARCCQLPCRTDILWIEEAEEVGNAN